MFAQSYGATTLGLNGVLITVEVDMSNSLPGLDIVGLPDTAVRESRERVRAAIKNSGFAIPCRRFTINLAPADLKKNSSGLDLPIAIGILAASGQLSADLRHCLFIAELSLDGRLRKVAGVLPMTLGAAQLGMSDIFVPPANAPEALIAGSLTTYAPHTLRDIILHLNGTHPLIPESPHNTTDKTSAASTDGDFADVQGQFAAKRALEIAAAGGHNILLNGSPGSGKTMLAKRLPSILPALSQTESLEVTKIYSIAGLLGNQPGLISIRPFRSPHHTISDAAMIGGGRIPHPGEVTLSHNGVLFLDELPEFPRKILEALRQPLEDRAVTVARINATLTYPANFMLIASMNPCPCGFLHDKQRDCSCSDAEIRRYQKKISGPLLDRIDIHIHVARLEYQDIISTQAPESSAVIQARVTAARQLQHNRLQAYGLFCNAQLGHRQIKDTCHLSTSAMQLLKQAFIRLNLSARAYDRIIKVSQTIADLSASPQIDAQHIAEAIHLRQDMTTM